ncbi:MAG TPA: hypothetical protein VF132_04180, partial [Rudaea sp.]
MPNFYDLLPVTALFVIGFVALLLAIAQIPATHRHWRARQRIRALHRAAWLLAFAAIALLAGGLGLALRGYRLLTEETPVATITSRQVAPQKYAVRVDFPDGSHASTVLQGDEWQLDARVIKWKPQAVSLGAKPLYRVDRISGRYRKIEQAQTMLPSVVALGDDSAIDLWTMKQRFPQWLAWIDADYGSAAY